MNLFRRLWQGTSSSPNAATVAAAIPESAVDLLHQSFREELKAAIRSQAPDLRVSLEPAYLELAPLGLVLETKVVEQNTHPNAVISTQLVRLSHPQHFPLPLQAYVVGYGTTPGEAVASGAQLYCSGVLAAVLEALAGAHEPALDWTAQPEGTRWHMIVGPLQVQGAWTGVPGLDPQHLASLCGPLLRQLRFHRPFHWLRLYLSRQPNGKVIVESLLDNEPWEPGMTLLQAEVATWPDQDQFAGQKQLLLFRRCG